MKSQKGFSLIELMVVVVIIGILATVGIPQYQKFQMKAKRSEAKSLLSAMYTAQKAFFAEWNQYYSDFDAVGYGLEGNLGYHVGFSSGAGNGPATHPNPGYAGAAGTTFNATAYCVRVDPVTAEPVCDLSKSGNGAGFVQGGSVVTVGGGGGLHAFIFSAASNLDNDAVRDVMRINHTRDLEQLAAWDDIARD